MSGIDSNVMWGIGAVMALIGIILVVEAEENEVVIFFDGHDVLITLIGVIFPVAAIWGFPISVVSDQAINGIINNIGDFLVWFAGASCALLNFKFSIKHTRSIPLGLLVGVYKIVFVIFMPFILFMWLDGAMDDEAELGDRIFAFILLLLCARIGLALINGPEVYAHKGWSELEQVNGDALKDS